MSLMGQMTVTTKGIITIIIVIIKETIIVITTIMIRDIIPINFSLAQIKRGERPLGGYPIDRHLSPVSLQKSSTESPRFESMKKTLPVIPFTGIVRANTK
jgi:hypothetical protein